MAALLPVLHESYRRIGRFQKSRTERNERAALRQLRAAGKTLAFFKPLVPRKKQPYFDAVLNESLSPSDRIISLDVAVGAMHIEFSMPRAYMHRESEQLRRALALSRHVASDATADAADPAPDVLVRGIGASPGFVTGKAALIRRGSDYRRLASGSIVVARMTRTDMIIGVEKIAGIVTDVGGSLCHAAIVARELGIPCVVGTESATQEIREKQLIAVNGSDGIVRACVAGEAAKGWQEAPHVRSPRTRRRQHARGD